MIGTVRLCPSFAGVCKRNKENTAAKVRPFPAQTCRYHMSILAGSFAFPLYRLHDDPRILHHIERAMSDVPRSALHDRLAARHQVVHAATAPITAQSVVSVLAQPFLDNLLDVHRAPSLVAGAVTDLDLDCCSSMNRVKISA
jgi:hypothetical protein